MLESMKTIQWFSENSEIQKHGTLTFGTFNVADVEALWIPAGYYDPANVNWALIFFFILVSTTFMKHPFRNKYSAGKRKQH